MREVEFRDGPKLVPDHVADLMARYKTYTMSYEEAKAKVNNGLLQDRLNGAADKLVRDHLSRFGQ